MGTKARLTCYLLFPVVVSLSAAAAEPVGWRTDWTGKYPDARPAAKWSATDNVIWKTPMPGWSNATPVIVKGHAFVCSEPTTLLCVDVESGAILWQRTNSYIEAMSPADAAEARRLLEKIDLAGLTRERRGAKSQLSRVRNALKKAPDDAAQLKQKADLEARIEELNARLRPVEHLVMPNAHGVNGHSSPTPVSDGERVYVLFGSGVAACYDLGGERLWARMVEKPKIGYGHSASPLLLEGKLIVHINGLTALDAATGETVWRSGAESSWGTPAPAKIGADSVVITPNGELFLAADGRRLARVKCKVRFSQPVAEGGLVYFVQNGGKAFRLPASLDAAPEQLWTTTLHKDRRYASPVVHDGLIYTVTQFGVFGVVDGGTGELVYERELRLGKRAQTFPSIALAGDYVFVSSSDGTTVVIEKGREFAEVARNTLEPFRSSPVFRGNRMYIRGLKHLYCIGPQ